MKPKRVTRRTRPAKPAEDGAVGVQFHVVDHGEPVLEGDEPKQPTEGTPEEGTPEQPTDVVVEELWTPEEAQLLAQGIWNFGFFFYGAEWLATNGDFFRSRGNIAHLLDRFLPKASTGGPVGLGIDIFSIGSDVAMSVAIRRELIKAGPKKLEDILGQAAKAPGTPPAPQAPGAPPQPPPAPPPPSDGVDSTEFRFDASLRRAVDNNPNDGSVFAEMGVE